MRDLCRNRPEFSILTFGQKLGTVSEQRFMVSETPRRLLRILGYSLEKRLYPSDSATRQSSDFHLCRACRKAFQIARNLPGKMRRDVEGRRTSEILIMSAKGLHDGLLNPAWLPVS